MLFETACIVTNRGTTVEVTVFTEIAAVQYTPQIAILRFKHNSYISDFKPHLVSVCSRAVRTESNASSCFNITLITFGTYPDLNNILS